MSELDPPGPPPGRVGPWSAAPELEAAAVREPVFHAPVVVVVLALLLVALYAGQVALGSEGLIDRFGFAPDRLAHGEWIGLLGALFLHGSWAHVLMNAVGLLAFGAPVARLFGPRGGGVAAFLVFYLACGVLSCIGYAALHPDSPNMLVGASGVVSGLMGAASRLIERRPGLAPFRSPAVIGMAVAWIVVNLLIAVVGFGPGTGGQPVAWEAHIAGYAAGLFLLGPALALFGRRREGASGP